MTAIELSVVAIGWLGTLVGWLYEWRAKRRERAAKETADAALDAAQNRADAAFFIPSVAKSFGMLPCGDGKVWHVANSNVLCYARDAVPMDIPAGTPVVLPLANDGEEVYGVTFAKLGISMRSIRYTDGERHLWGILEYPFDPASFGQREIVEVHFESRKGFQRIHRYAMEHGRRQFVRIDPPLPV